MMSTVFRLFLSPSSKSRQAFHRWLISHRNKGVGLGGIIRGGQIPFTPISPVGFNKLSEAWTCQLSSSPKEFTSQHSIYPIAYLDHHWEFLRGEVLFSFRLKRSYFPGNPGSPLKLCQNLEFLCEWPILAAVLVIMETNQLAMGKFSWGCIYIIGYHAIIPLQQSFAIGFSCMDKTNDLLQMTTTP